MQNKDYKIGIIGLGYVGFPLAIEFSKKFKCIGFDINESRVKDLLEGNDRTLEIQKIDILKQINTGSIEITDKIEHLSLCNFYIITVPTPIDKNNKPNLKPLLSASKIISPLLKRGDIVVYESTVYPGVTEEICVPELEKYSELIFNKDFFVGYSPERINPGDKLHTVTNIVKVTSGSNEQTAIIVDEIYKEIIQAGTYKATSIKVAEAAKVIENSQRDINIAFVNELSKIFNLMGLDTNEILDTAATKWNFLRFSPGLVGGHCIGVDPYYLAQKAQEIGFHPEIILAGRRTNDSMGQYVAIETIKKMIKKDIKIKGANILILGFTFKENCPDVRNTRVIDIYKELESFNLNIELYDPWARKEEVLKEYNINLLESIDLTFTKYSAIILAVAHQEFLNLNIENSEKLVVYDVKSVLKKNVIDGRL